MKKSNNLPCKIGDTVYCIRNFKGQKRIKKGIVSEMFYRKDMELMIVVSNIGRGLYGEKVFNTMEEAERYLKCGVSKERTGGPC